MAGFFGLFNYEKEGPGIDKDAPKKKGIIVFFETFFRNFWKFITINLVYFLISLPIVTGGMANAGITNVTRNIARDKHSFGLSDFFDTIKKNWKQSLIVGILNVLITAVIGFSIWFYYTSEGLMSTIGLGVSFSVLLIFLIMQFYIWTLMITFKYTIKQLYSNSFKFVFINLKSNLLCGILLLLVYAVYVAVFFLLPYYILLIIEMFLALCTLPAFRFLMIQYFTFPAIKKHIIDPYYEQNPDADIELRRNLGLEVDEQPIENTFDDELHETDEN